MEYKEINNAGVLGIIGNFFLMIIKLCVGYITKSNAMMADAFNSTGDVFSSIITVIGNKISSKPRDDDHNLGHGKAIYIFSLIISLTMFMLVYKIIFSSIKSLIYGNDIIYSNYLILVCSITIIVKLLLFLKTNYLYKKYNNVLIKANANDHRNDIILTSLNLVSIIFAKYNITLLDSFVGIIISIWILLSALSIFKESYDVLMDKSISMDIKEEIINIIKENKQILKINHFNSTPVGNKYQISVTIFVDGNLTTFESHKIADNLEKEIIKRMDIISLAIIHVNPM